MFSYRIADGGDADSRRVAGMFNDYAEDHINSILKLADWRLIRQDAEGPHRLFVCERQN